MVTNDVFALMTKNWAPAITLTLIQFQFASYNRVVKIQWNVKANTWANSYMYSWQVEWNMQSTEKNGREKNNREVKKKVRVKQKGSILWCGYFKREFQVEWKRRKRKNTKQNSTSTYQDSITWNKNHRCVLYTIFLLLYRERSTDFQAR